MEDFINARSLIRKEIDNLTQHRNEAEKMAKRTLEFIKTGNQMSHINADIINVWWQDYGFYKGKVQGLDIAIANLEIVIRDICRLQDIEKYKKMMEEEKRE